MENTEEILLKDYSNEEKAAYFGALATMASVDGIASPEEIEFLKMMAEAAELPENIHHEIEQIAKKPDIISLQRCLEVIKNSPLRFSFITDIISFAKADGKYTDDEKEKIQDVADYLNVNQEQFSILDQFVNKANDAQQQGEDPTSQSFIKKNGFNELFNKVGISPGMAQGLLGIVAPMVISSMLSGGRRRGRNGSMGGGLLGGMLGGGGMYKSGGGLGSIISVLGGLNGRRGYSGMGAGGLGSLFGGLMGNNRRRSGW